MKPLWHCYGTAMALLWHCFSTAMALLWHCYGTALALLWHCFSTAMALLEVFYINYLIFYLEIHGPYSQDFIFFAI